jgi:ubiquinone/menaquinone biosynthesis C-methylase UbiE
MIPAMQELYRVLKPGGMAILQIPQDLKRDDNIMDDIPTKKNALKYLDNTTTCVFTVAIILPVAISFTVVEEDYTNKIASELVEKYCLAKEKSYQFVFK